MSLTPHHLKKHGDTIGPPVVDSALRSEFTRPNSDWRPHYRT